MLARRQFLQLVAASAAPGGGPVKYALFDSRVIESERNTRIVPGPVKKDRRPLFGEDKPWEVRMDNVYANVMFDDARGLYRCWYSPFILFRDRWDGRRWVKPDASPTREMAICYATSKDGLHWEKPELGLVEWRGNKRNNMIRRGPHGAGIFQDRHETDPARRFKMFYNQPDIGGSHGVREMRVAFSRDGLHWSRPVSCPEINARGDTHNNALWDARSGKYVAFTRLFDGEQRQRIVGRTESEDFIHWTKAEEVLRGDTARQTYAMPVFPFCNAYLGLLMVFDIQANTVDCELAWSPNTARWERLAPGRPLIPRGPEGSHDHGCIFGAAYPIERNGELVLYYGGNDRGHNGPRKGFFCRARLRADGFAARAAATKSDVAEILTSPLECAGRKLRVTVDARGGRLRAGIRNSESLSVDRSLPITADVTNGAVSWKNELDLTAIQERKVQLWFELNNARLYTFHFGD